MKELVKMREDAMNIFSDKEIGSVRAFKENGEAWFSAKDVCEILDIANSRDAVSRLDDDEKGVVNTDTLGGTQTINIVNTAGLYRLIFRSRKPQAKAFKRWVTHVVLPSILEGKNSAGAHAYVFGQEEGDLKEVDKVLKEAAKVTKTPHLKCIINGMVMTREKALAWDFD